MHDHDHLDRHPRRPPGLDDAIAALDTYLEDLDACDRARALHWLHAELDARHDLQVARLTRSHP